MTVQISGAAIERFSQKLANFSNTLSDEERTLFKGMLERGSGLSADELSKVQGGAPLSGQLLQFGSFAPHLQANFFTRLMCW
jgi:hypothetical protein